MSYTIRPTDIGEGCIVVAREFSMEREEAQLKLGDDMLQGLLSQGYAAAHPKTGTITITEAGKRRAADHRDPLAKAVSE